MPPKATLKANPLRRYQLRLAERLGKTLHELERDVSIGELVEWMAHDELERDKPTTRHWRHGQTPPLQ